MNTTNSPKKHPNAVSKGLIIGLSLLLGICLVPTIITLSVNQTLFKTDFYAGVLKKTNFYEQLPVLLSDSVMSSGTSALQGGILAGLDQEQFKWLMLSILPHGWIETETNAAMASVLDYLNLETKTLSIVIDFQPIKDYLASPAGKQALVNLLDNLPECSEEQLTQIMIAMQSGQGGFALCHPPASDYFNMDTMLDPVIYSFSTNLPNAIILPPEGQGGIIENLINSPIFQLYRSLRGLLLIFPWICLILAAIIFLLSLRSLRWMTGAFGLPLIFASMVASLPGAWLFLMGGRDLTRIFADNGVGTLQGLEGLLVQVFQQGLQTAGQGMLFWCLGTLALGLVLLVVWFITNK